MHVIKLTLVLFITLHGCSGTQFKVTDQVYLDISKDEGFVGRIIVGLFGDIAPKTVDNFKRLATEGIDGKTYAGTAFHRVVKKFMIQGGDIIFNNGSGSMSFYGPEFEDENLETTYEISGLISMANRGKYNVCDTSKSPNNTAIVQFPGKDTNGCQFFINTVPTPWLNGKHTIFGKVVEGQDYVHAIEYTQTDADDRPIKPIYVSDCGEIPTPSPFYVSDQPYDLWAWIKASFVPLTMSFSILGLFHWFIRKMEI